MLGGGLTKVLHVSLCLFPKLWAKVDKFIEGKRFVSMVGPMAGGREREGGEAEGPSLKQSNVDRLIKRNLGFGRSVLSVNFHQIN